MCVYEAVHRDVVDVSVYEDGVELGRSRRGRSIATNAPLISF